jgi:hypothetical protein
VGRRSLLRRLRLRLSDAKEDVYLVPHQLSGHGRQYGHFPLRETDADYEIRILAVA